MAAVFTLLFLVAIAGFAGCLGAYLALRKRAGSRAFALLPLAGLVAAGIALLLAKFLREELIPCLTVGGACCDFTATVC